MATKRQRTAFRNQRAANDTTWREIPSERNEKGKRRRREEGREMDGDEYERRRRRRRREEKINT